MSDTPGFSPIRSGPPPASQSPQRPDENKFKKELEKDTKKVGKIDPEEQKKRRQTGEKGEVQEDLESKAVAHEKKPSPLHLKPELKLKEGQELKGTPGEAKIDQIEGVQELPGDEDLPPPVKSKGLEKKASVVENVPLNKETKGLETDKSARHVEEPVVSAQEERVQEELRPKEEILGSKPLEDLLLEDIRQESQDLPPEGAVSQKPTLEKIGEEGRKELGVKSSDAVTGRLAPPPPTPLSGYSALSKEVQKLYDLMVGAIMVIQETHKTEVRVTLNLPTNSVLNGTEIVVQEFATAKKEFNIQLQASPEALSTLQQHLPSLQKAFAEGNYNFKVQQLNIISRGT